MCSPLFLLLLVVCCFIPSIRSSSEHCPANCLCEDRTKTVKCVNADLRTIPNDLDPYVEILVLKQNKITALHGNLFFFTELKQLDLTENEISSIKSTPFQQNGQLEIISFASNEITEVNKGAFLGLGSLEKLNLSRNSLQGISEKWLSPLHELQELDLSYNRIYNISNDSFKGLKKLAFINLRRNFLKVIPAKALLPVDSVIASLDLSYNPFNMFKDNVFKTLQSLTNLKMSGCGITNISNNSFNGLKNLRLLEFDDNLLTKVPTQQLSKLEHLEELYIGKNKFSDIPSEAFEGLTKLEWLDISECKELQVIHSDAFTPNIDLVFINLNSSTKLQELEDGALKISSLNTLALHNSGLTFVNQDAAYWEDIQALDLSGNPILCNCDMLWFRDEMKRRNDTKVLCDTPPNLKKTVLIGLSNEDLSCTVSSSKNAYIIAVSCTVVGVVIVALAFVIFKYRRQIKEALRTDKLHNSTISAPDYQKTNLEGEYMILKAPTRNPENPVPVTEL